MAFTRFNTRPKEEALKKKPSAAVSTVMESEKLFQIAVLLPATTIVGWFVGSWLDRHFGQHWIGITGMLVGGVLGMAYVIRLSLMAFKDEESSTDVAKDEKPENRP